MSSCLFFVKTSAFLFQTSSHFGYCKTVTNFISQLYFIKTYFESC